MNWYSEQEFSDLKKQQEILAKCRMPKHIGIIMDGNGRWAIEHGLTRTEGHKQGIESVRDIVKATAQLGIPYLTLYAFSLENWKRPSSEVGVLMNLLEYYLKKEIKELNANNVRLLSIGKISSLPKKIQRLLFDAIELTSKNTGLTLTLALSYSGRWDIVRAVQMIAHDIRRGNISPEDITEEVFSSYLQTAPLPDPDLIIRTSGEMRLSNFLLWESAYSEIYISNKYWPEFRREDLYTAIIDYSGRERRFGRISSQLKQEIPNHLEKVKTEK
ncbi:MAG: isoprenyl transferase [Ignavibacteria bacterium]|nr:isoprenyl transferase [Ignavibacteria bacterium]